MIHGLTIGILHHVVEWLLYPVLLALGIALLAVIWEIGTFVSEGLGSLRNLSPANIGLFADYAEKHLERVDLLSRTGPILGLMGTLIPLGPGLAALSNGDLSQLATAMMVAFDTTVLGLGIGLVGYTLGRVRRRWYEQTFQQLESGQANAEAAHEPA